MMQRVFAGILLFAFMLPPCAQAQQGEVPADCDNNMASAPGQAKEYDFFKHVTASARGCTSPSPVTYEKYESKKTGGPSAPSGSVSSHQEEADRAACRTEGENAAKAAHGLQPGEYDLFKNIAATRSDDVEKVEQSCMAARGYQKTLN